jgi:hypothetical protein
MGQAHPYKPTFPSLCAPKEAFTMKMNYLLMLVLSILLATGLSFSTTFYVNGSANGCRPGSEMTANSINGAIALAAGGDTIIVCKNGSNPYTQNVAVTVSVKIYGNESNVLINGTGSADVVVISVDNVRLANLSLIDFGGDTNGVQINGAYGTTITDCTFNSTIGGSGVYTQGVTSQGTSISNNIFEGCTIALNKNENSSITNNRFIGSSSLMSIAAASTISLDEVNNLTISGNNATQFYSGIYVNRSYNVSTPIVIANNLFVNSTYGILMDNSYVNFSGNNNIVTVLPTNFELYLRAGSILSTGIYNLTTDFGSFGLGNSGNFSLKVVRLDNMSLSQTVSAIDSLTITSAKAINYTNNSYFLGLNVTNLSGTASISPTMYYNDSDAASYSTMSLGRYNGSTWFALSATAAANAISYTGFTGPFSYFVPLAYTLYVAPTTSSSGSSTPAPKKLVLTKSFDCAKGELTITATYSDTGVSDMELKLFDTSNYGYQTKTTNGDGKAVFVVAHDGSYQVDSTYMSGYAISSLNTFDLALCKASVTSPVTQPVTPQQPATPSVAPTIPETKPPEVTAPTGPTPLDNALSALAAADSAVSAAVAEGKDVSAARAKVDEANAAVSAKNYELAITLANQAAELAKNAAAKPKAPEVVAPVKPAVTATPSKGSDMTGIIIGLAVVAIVVLGFYFFTRGGKKSLKGHFKGHLKGHFKGHLKGHYHYKGHRRV